MSITRGLLKQFIKGAEPVAPAGSQETLTRFPKAPPVEATPQPDRAVPRRVVPTHGALTRFETTHKRPERTPVKQRAAHQAEARIPTRAELGHAFISLTNEPSDTIPVDVLRAALPSRFATAAHMAELDDFHFNG